MFKNRKKGIVFSSLSLLVVIFIAACTSDDNVFFGDISWADENNVEEFSAVEKVSDGFFPTITVRDITADDIPKGLGPRNFDSEDEFWAYVESLKSEEIRITSLPQQPVARVKMLKNRSEVSPSGIVTDEKDVSGHTVLITISWNKIGGELDVSSRRSDFWGYNFDWQEDAATAHWSETTLIDYTVTGSVVEFANVNGQLKEIKRTNVRLSGTVNACNS